MYLYKYIYIYIGGLMEYISKKVAAYGQFVLVYSNANHDRKTENISNTG